MEHDAFVFYKSYFEAAADLSAKERLKFYDALTGYALYGKEPDLPKCPARSLFIALKPAIDKGLKTSDKRRKAIYTRWDNVSAKDDTKRIQTRYKIDTKETDVSSDCNSNEIQNDTLQDTRHKTQDTRLDNVSCPEPSSEPPVITLPLNDGSEYSVTESDVEGWNISYPAVDVMQQLRNMREWLLSNPTRRKTKSGVRRFITTWLAREQDRGGTRGQPAARSGTTERQGITRNDDIDSLVRDRVLEGL